MFQNITNKSTFQQQLKIIDNNQQQQQNATSISSNSSKMMMNLTSSTPSATRKRTQTWIEGTAILNHRNKMVASDVDDAWENLLRQLPSSSTFSNNNTNSSSSSRLYCASLHHNNPQQQHQESFLNEFGFSSSKQNERDGLTILSSPAFSSSRFDNENNNNENQPHPLSFSSGLETQQVLTTHRQLRQSLDRLKKDELGLANLVSNATEQLDLGEGLRGTSVARVRSACQTIETSLGILKEEERALGDVVAEAEKACASVTKKMMMSPFWKERQQQEQQEKEKEKSRHCYFDPCVSSASVVETVDAYPNQQQQVNNHNMKKSSSSFLSADEKLRQFLDRVGGRSLGWSRQEHDCFMHILFSGGFEDPSVTNATPTLGIRTFSSNNNNNNNNSLADDEQWVAAQVVEKLSPLLPHRLPDDIRKHLALQRELEFLEGQRRLEVKSWRDQREADAALDMGVAAALAREDAELEHEHRKETEFERRARQEHLHELVESWRMKKEEAAATAKAAMAVTQRAIEDARNSRRVAIQAATKERNNQLLERRQMLKNAALWSNAAKALGCASGDGGDATSARTTMNFANRQHNIPVTCSSNMDKASLNYALQERREQAMNKARERRAAVEAKEKQKTEREERMKIRAEMVRMVPEKESNNNNNNNTKSSTSMSRLMQPTKSMTARKEATIEQETAANLQSKALCRQTPYFTPRTMSSHRRAAPFM